MFSWIPYSSSLSDKAETKYLPLLIFYTAYLWTKWTGGGHTNAEFLYKQERGIFALFFFPIRFLRHTPSFTSPSHQFPTASIHGFYWANWSSVLNWHSYGVRLTASHITSRLMEKKCNCSVVQYKEKKKIWIEIYSQKAHPVRDIGKGNV